MGALLEIDRESPCRVSRRRRRADKYDLELIYAEYEAPTLSPRAEGCSAGLE